MVSVRRVPTRGILLAVLVLVFAAALAVPAGAYGVALGSISGHVTAAGTSDALADICVELYYWDGADWVYYQETYTDSSGYYAFTDLDAHSYKVVAYDWEDVYVAQWYNAKPDMSSANQIAISGNDVTANFALEETPHGTINGRVIDEAYHEGIEGIVVNAYAYDPSEPDFMNWVGDATTDEAGDYSLDVPAGQIVVEFSDWERGAYIPEFYNNTTAWASAAKIAVADEAVVNNINAVLAEGGHITGTVTAEATGEPLSGVRVVAMVPPTGEEMGYEAFTRTDGTYEIAGLPTGSYVVMFVDIGETDPSFERIYLDEFYNGATTWGGATTLSVTAPATRTNVNASMRVGNSISGQVTESGTGETIWIDGWGQGIQVGLYDTSGNEVGWTMTREDGTYHLGGLPDGSYKVKFYDWGYDGVGDPGNQFYVTQWYSNKASFAAANTVAVSGQQVRTGVNAAMVSTGQWGTISGTITDAVNGQPVPGAYVSPFVQYTDGTDLWWTESWDVPPVATDGTGSYLLDYVPAGTYRLVMAGWHDWEYGLWPQLWGYQGRYYSNATEFDSATNVVVAAGANVTGKSQALPRLDGTVSLQGTLVDSVSGGPIGAGIPVDIYNYDADAGEYWWYATAVTNGSSFWSWPVEPGRYKVAFNQAGWYESGLTQSPDYTGSWYNSAATFEGATAVDTIAGGPTVVNDELVAAIHVTGVVTDGAAPLEGATVGIYSFDGEYWNPEGSAVTNASGVYDIGSLRPGTYRLQFWPAWPNPERLASEVYPDRPNLDYGQDIVLVSGTYGDYDAVLEPGVEFRGVVPRDDSDANVDQSIKVHVWFDDPTEGWIEVQSTYAYAWDSDQFWVPVLPAGDYRLNFEDADFGSYLPLWYSNEIASAGADILSPAGGSAAIISQTMDGLPPVTTTNALGGYKGPANITISATDAGVGVDTTYYSLDDAPDVEGTSVSVSTLGAHTLTYYSVDRLGNAESARTVEFEVFAPDAFETVPVAGATRIDTAIAASQEAFDAGEADTVVVATGYNWPDALGGAALAGAYDGPILLTKPDDLPSTVASEIQRLGADNAVILGGTSAVNAAVEAELNALLSGTVERISGSDRYATARAVAAKTVELLGSDYDGTAFVATGGKFPDALGASALAAAKCWPIYLADPRYDLPAVTTGAMQTAGVTDVIVLGGTAVVTPQVETTLKGLVGTARVTRLAGDDRYDTACVVAQYGVDHAGLFWNRAALATGQNFPDALAGGILQGRSNSVILLTPATSLDSGVRAKLETNADQIAELRYLGGLNAVTQAVRDAAEAAID